jgi:acetyltransferase-like isoleucine patch superfamily enzyme
MKHSPNDPRPSSHSILLDPTPLPPPASTPEEDEALFSTDPWIETPIRIDYGSNVKLGQNVFINFNCTILDTCAVTIGDRTLIASSVSIYAATHPLDPELRNGTAGPESGAEIHIGKDCWIGGNACILPGVTIGDGSVVGAGSVVTKVGPSCGGISKFNGIEALTYLAECSTEHGGRGQSGEDYKNDRAGNA